MEDKGCFFSKVCYVVSSEAISGWIRVYSCLWGLRIPLTFLVEREKAEFFLCLLLLDCLQLKIILVWVYFGVACSEPFHRHSENCG